MDVKKRLAELKARNSVVTALAYVFLAALAISVVGSVCEYYVAQRVWLGLLSFGVIPLAVSLCLVAALRVQIWKKNEVIRSLKRATSRQ
jgi:MFS-type transporter involved in bile tolerance (Atg22 family)